MNDEVEISRREFHDVKWCTKPGAIVDNGSSAHVAVWVSSDGALVLPMGGNANMKHVETGTRIQMLRQIWFVCNKGDLATVASIRDGNGHGPKSWFVTMDNGGQTYVFEGEFEVVQEDAGAETPSEASVTHA